MVNYSPRHVATLVRDITLVSALSLAACGKGHTSSIRALEDNSRIHVALLGPGATPSLGISAPSTTANILLCQTPNPADCRPGAPGYAVAAAGAVRGDMRFFTTQPAFLSTGLVLSILALDASNNVIESTRVMAREGGAASTIEAALGLVDAAGMSKIVNFLASRELDGRRPKTEGSKKAQAAIIQAFQEAGLQPGVNGQWTQPFDAGENVIGVLRGTDPTLQSEVIVIGGHMDHLGNGKLGADDNASGTAGVMGAARILGAVKNQLKRTVLFMAFDAEERGLLGSEHYVDNAVLPIEKTVYMFNLDMIGYLSKNGSLEGLGGGSSRSASDLIKATAQKHNITRIGMTSNGGGSSDHASFAGKRIPHVFFHTGTKYSPYHQVGDTADKLDYEGVAAITRLTADSAFQMAVAPQAPSRSNQMVVSSGISLRKDINSQLFIDHGVTPEMRAELEASLRE